MRLHFENQLNMNWQVCVSKVLIIITIHNLLLCFGTVDSVSFVSLLITPKDIFPTIPTCFAAGGGAWAWSSFISPSVCLNLLPPAPSVDLRRELTQVFTKNTHVYFTNERAQLLGQHPFRWWSCVLLRRPTDVRTPRCSAQDARFWFIGSGEFIHLCLITKLYIIQAVLCLVGVFLIHILMLLAKIIKELVLGGL